MQTSVVTEDHCVRCAQVRPMKGLLTYKIHAFWIGSERSYRLFCSVCDYVDPRPTIAFGRDQEDKLIPFNHRHGLLIGLVSMPLFLGVVVSLALWSEHGETVRLLARLDELHVGDVYELMLKQGYIETYTSTIVVAVKGDEIAVRQAPHFFYERPGDIRLSADARSVANDSSRPVAVISKDKLKTLHDQGVLLSALRADKADTPPSP